MRHMVDTAGGITADCSAAVLLDEVVDGLLDGAEARHVGGLALGLDVAATTVEVLQLTTGDGLAVDHVTVLDVVHDDHDITPGSHGEADLGDAADGTGLPVDDEEQGPRSRLGRTLDIALELRRPVGHLGVEEGHPGRFERRDGRVRPPGRRVAGAAEENVDGLGLRAHGIMSLL